MSDDRVNPLPSARLIATIYSCECAKQPSGHVAYFDLHGLTEDQGVAGNSLYQDEIEQALRSTGPDGRVTAVLVPEPTNFHDRTAVRVDVLAGDRQLKVGYIPRDDAREYFTLLFPLAEAGLFGIAKARVWRGEVGYRLYLRLNAPEWCIPRSAPTEDGKVLVAERDTAVVGSVNFQAPLKALIGSRKEKQHTFRVRLGAQPSGKYAGEDIVEVHDDDKIVGRLTRRKSDEYLDAIRSADALNAPVFAVGNIFRHTDEELRILLLLPVVRYRKNFDEYFYNDELTRYVSAT